MEKINKFGLTADQVSKIKNITPSYNLGKLEVGSTAKFKILSNDTKEVKFLDDEGEEISQLTLNVKCLDDNKEYLLWLSSMSLGIEFQKLSDNNKGNIKDLVIDITIREYKHKKYGLTRAYTVTQIKE